MGPSVVVWTTTMGTLIGRTGLQSGWLQDSCTVAVAHSWVGLGLSIASCVTQGFLGLV